MTTLAVCITSFNRRETTLRCLSSLFGNAHTMHLSVDVYHLDDASTDGSAEAVKELYPQVISLSGNGKHFWAGGMRAAYGAAVAHGYDYYLWLNDDVELFPDSLCRAIDTHKNLVARLGGDHLVVGAMLDPANGATSYSGFVRASRFFPWIFRQTDPEASEPKECMTVNGNFVLIPHEVAKKVGSINPAFIQTLADLDLGLKVRRGGGRNWIMPRYAGRCKPNTSGRKSFNGPNLTLQERFKMMEHPLGHPFLPSLAYSWNFGMWAPVVVAMPYLGLIRNLLRYRKTSRKTL